MQIKKVNKLLQHRKISHQVKMAEQVIVFIMDKGYFTVTLVMKIGVTGMSFIMPSERVGF